MVAVPMAQTLSVLFVQGSAHKMLQLLSPQLKTVCLAASVWYVCLK